MTFLSYGCVEELLSTWGKLRGVNNLSCLLNRWISAQKCEDLMQKIPKQSFLLAVCHPPTKLLYKIVCTFYNHHWEMKSQKYPTCCLMISTTGLWAITQIFFCVLSVAQHSCHTRQAFKGFDRQTKQKKKTTWMWCLCPVKKGQKKARRRI